MKQKIQAICRKADSIFSSAWVVPIAFFLAFVLYIADKTAYAVGLFACAAALVLFFCKDVKNIYAFVFYIPFFIKDIYSDPRWIVYGISIGLFCTALVAFAVRALLQKERPLKKGAMFYPLLIADIAFLLGGIWGHFSLRVFLITLFFSLASYLLYWVAVNFTQHLKEYLFFLFIIGTVFILFQTMIQHVQTEDWGLFVTKVPWIGSQNINVASLFVLFGIIGCFGLGVGKKYDLAYLALSLVFSFGAFMMYCRMVLLLLIPILIFCIIYMLIKSPNKKIFLSASGVIALVLIVLALIFRTDLYGFVQDLIESTFSGLSGRLDLWTWCVNQFNDNALFGTGFVADMTDGELLPGLDSNPKLIILAHNTPIQWLVSLGLVGCMLMFFYYLGKYKVVLDKVNRSALFLLIAVFAIELNGLMDQASVMDIFVYILSLLLLAALEKEPKCEQIDLFCKQDFTFKTLRTQVPENKLNEEGKP